MSDAIPAAETTEAAVTTPALIEEEGIARWKQRTIEAEARWSATHGFSDVVDRAALIQRFHTAMASRYSEVNDDHILKPIIAAAHARYQELRVYDFTYASRVSVTEAIRAILALSDDVLAYAR